MVGQSQRCRHSASTMAAHHNSRRTLVQPIMDITRVIAAIESLYMDQLKPYGRILRKRLSERAGSSEVGEADIDVYELRRACLSCTYLHVQSEDGGDWSVLLCGRTSDFVDVYSPIDIYSPELWGAATDYFEKPDGSQMVLPGGRYACAQALVMARCHFLMGFTLGHVCHIVQLAISQKKILGYLNGAIVPYARSQSMVKERCAEKQRACGKVANGTNNLAGWEVLRSGLIDIMSGSKPVPLSNFKRLFRTRFRVELSETALGHSKLSELFQDVRLQDICDVRLQGHGYVVAPKMNVAFGSLSSARIADVHSVGGQTEMAMQLPQVTIYQPQFLFMSNQYPCSSSVVTTQPAVTQSGISDHATLSPPISRPCERSFRNRAPRAQLCLDDVIHSEPPPPPQHAPTVHSAIISDVDAFFDVRTPSPYSPQPQREQALPRLLGSLHARRSRFSNNAKLTSLSDQAELDAIARTPTADCMPLPATPEPWPMLLTPGTLGNLRSSVQNTFVHLDVPPATPHVGAASRSLSVPRNIGCKKGLAVTPVGSAQAGLAMTDP